MNLDKFDLESGALCLDFANTVEWHASDQPEDLLNDFSDLIAWGVAAGLLLPDQAKGLLQNAESQPAEAAALFEKAIRLRESIYRIFSSFTEKGSVNSDDLTFLNEVLSKSMSHLGVVPFAQGFILEWMESPDGPDQILWSVARSAGELLTSDKLDRVSQCADDRGCGYLFVDTSRNKSRRWCSMESCGNRAKARRHYKRQKADQPHQA